MSSNFITSTWFRRSHASIRSIADLSDGPFDYKDAVSALRNLEFDSNVGNIKISKLDNGHCPFIVEFKNKEKFVVTKIIPKKEYQVFDINGKDKFKIYNFNEFKKNYAGGVLLAKSRKQIRDGKKQKKLIGFGHH